MRGYWRRHRLVYTIIMSAFLAAGTVFCMFVFTSQRASQYNSQSVYRNSSIDFIVPEPSMEQSEELLGTYGISQVFPFFLTKTPVSVRGKSRTTTVLFSDKFENVDSTMYCPSRLIEVSDKAYDNPILVDWQFCHDTSSQIGDTVTVQIGEALIDYQIHAIYETNSIYEGGAILAEIGPELKNAIMQKSKNSGYSGMYVIADDYTTCRNYLISEYRPLGRLKDRSLFGSDEQYQIHYNAIMSGGYANEIADLRIRENTLHEKANVLMVLIATILCPIILIIFNILMARRGCEKAFFTKQSIPAGQNVMPYYWYSALTEMLLSICLYCGMLVIAVKTSNQFIPKGSLGVYVAIVPMMIIVSDILIYKWNQKTVIDITAKVKLESEKRQCRETREAEQALKNSNPELENTVNLDRGVKKEDFSDEEVH